MCVHTGTHIDAPAHFIDEGEDISALGLERLLGRVQVVDTADASAIGAAELKGARIRPGCDRLLLRTSNSRRLRDTPFDQDYVALTPGGAEWLVDNGISLVGIDYASVEAFEEPENRTHKILLGAGVVVLEGLDLSGVSAGLYELICLPMKIGAAEAAPARVVLVATGGAA